MRADKLRQHYIALLPTMMQTLHNIQETLCDLPKGEFTTEFGIKPYKSVKRKVLERKPKKLQDLSDLVRGRIFFSDNFNFQDIEQLLRQFFGKNIVDIDHKPRTNEDHGLVYSGVSHVDLQLDNLKVELQLLPIEFHPYKDFLHSIYEKLRGKSSLSEPQKDFLKNVHNKMYAALEEKAKQARNKE